MIKSRIPLITLATLSVFVALVSFRFLAIGMEHAFMDMLEHIANKPTAFLLHVVASPIALTLGAFQFFPKFRKARPAFHRWTGRAYGVAVLVGGISGLVIAVSAKGGIAAQLGFSILAVLWVVFTAIAVHFAMKRKIGKHRRWMIRSFALTFAAVTLRLYLPIFFANGFDYTQASVYVAWMCWVPNLIFAQWWLNR